ncbi:MAG: formylmethanofuran dehydrogenase subunit C [Chromatiales bacterium]
MSLTLSLHTAPQVPLEAEGLIPERLEGLDSAAVARLPLLHGNENVHVGDFFKVEGKGNGELRLEGDLSRVKLLGANMSRGRLTVNGNVGLHLGAAMTGGEVIVDGNAGDWVGPEMAGGSIVIRGNAGHMVGSVHRGGSIGMRGGEIVVHGSAGNEIGNGMRNGLIVIGGDSGDFTGVSMRAGTIIVLGHLGWRSGAGMKRGSIASMHEAELLPTFSYACTYRPVFLRLYLLQLRELGLPVGEACVNGEYRRYSGDAIELNRGEILLLTA